jgi:hypothetical protein
MPLEEKNLSSKRQKNKSSTTNMDDSMKNEIFSKARASLISYEPACLL